MSQNKSISQAIKTQDMAMLTEVVESQVAIYGAALPDEDKAMVNTIHGDMPISMIFDDETKWAVITGEYVRIVNAVKALPKGVDEKVETAKIIANSAMLRHVTSSVQSTNSVL